MSDVEWWFYWYLSLTYFVCAGRACGLLRQSTGIDSFLIEIISIVLLLLKLLKLTLKLKTNLAEKYRFKKECDHVALIAEINTGSN